MDDHAVRIFSGQAGKADEVDMPMTFELITITPTWVEYCDFSSIPANIEHVGE